MTFLFAGKLRHVERAVTCNFIWHANSNDLLRQKLYSLWNDKFRTLRDSLDRRVPGCCRKFWHYVKNFLYRKMQFNDNKLLFTKPHTVNGHSQKIEEYYLPQKKEGGLMCEWPLFKVGAGPGPGAEPAWNDIGVKCADHQDSAECVSGSASYLWSWFYIRLWVFFAVCMGAWVYTKTRN